jgi:methionyl-tRNA formyltransferase
MEPDSLDSGDIVARRPMSLTHESTIGDVLRFIETSIPSMFLEALDSIEKGTVERVSQSSLGIEGFRCYPRTPLHGKIDWHQSAAQIDALVRATGRPYPGAYSYATIGGQLKRVRIWSTRVVASRTPDLGVPGHVIRNDPLSGESWVYTGEGIIGLRSIQYDEGEEFAPGAVWKSIRFGFQVDLEAELIELRRLISKREV